jgi:EAL domain-containing protein (putative c-di-GMP-specific phosphodiesterase class I)
LLGSLRQSLAGSPAEESRTVNTGVFGLVATGACVLVVSTILFLDNKSQQAQRSWQAENNLLQLRVQWHKLVAKEWGRKDQINAVVAGDPADDLKEGLAASTILHDGQNILIADADGRILFDSLSGAGGKALGPVARQELQRCVSQKLGRVIAFRCFEPASAYGWICRDTHVFAIGAVAGVMEPGGQASPKGWFFHFSQVMADDDDPTLRSAFSKIRDDLSLAVDTVPLLGSGVEGLNFSSAPVFSISDLEPSSAPWRLQQTVPWRQLLVGYGLDVLIPWFILCLGLGAVGLLRLRPLHKGPRRKRRGLLTAPRAFRVSRRQGLPASLPVTSDLADALPLMPALVKAHPLPLLVVLSPLIRAFDGSVPNGMEALNRILVLLEEGFGIAFPAALLCRSPELAMVAVVPLPEALNRHVSATREELVARVQAIIDRTTDNVNAVIRVDVNASLAWLKPDRIGPQILDLITVNRQTKHHCPPAFLDADAAEKPALMRSQISQDFEVVRLAENFFDHHYRLEDVIIFVGNQQRVAYREMLFSPSKNNHPDVPLQDLIHSLERTSAIHLIDRSMLRKALSISTEALKQAPLQGERRLPDGPRQPGEFELVDAPGLQDEPLPLIATNLSALTIQSELHRNRIFDMLEAAPASVRQTIVVEITETALLGDESVWLDFFRRLGRLGVRIAIDDFGCGYAALSYLFRYPVDFIKVDLQYARLTCDRRVNAMVEFLLSFEVGYPTRVIMEGIETQSQLSHWRQKGVTHFQGYLFASPPQS